MEHTDSQDGFTLVELLMVVLLLGVVATLVLLGIGDTRKRSVASSCKTNYRSIELSAEYLHAKNGAYPDVQEKLTLKGPASAARSAEPPSSETKGLLRTWPTARPDYWFDYKGHETGFEIWIHGGNVVGTKDEKPLTDESTIADLSEACTGTL